MKDGDAVPGKEIVLSNCDDPDTVDLACVWRIDYAGMFHSALDDTLCMQIGFQGKVGKGARIRLGICDEWGLNDGQLFSWADKEAPIDPTSKLDLCMLSWCPVTYWIQSA